MNKKVGSLTCHTCKSRNKSVFCNISEKALDFLNQEKNYNTYKKGQNIFLEGNPPFGLYCVHSGKVKVFKTTEDGKETILRIANTSELLGHRSFFSKKPYNATATVIEDAEICFLNGQVISRLIQMEPQISQNIISILSKQMGMAENKVVSLASKNLRERLAELLINLNTKYGVFEPDTNRYKLEIKLSREEMASMIGSATENLIRLLSEFKKDNILEQEGKVLYIKNLPSLEELKH
jgi:CRP-like cAMP-binding protein